MSGIFDSFFEEANKIFGDDVMLAAILDDFPGDPPPTFLSSEVPVHPHDVSTNYSADDDFDFLLFFDD